MNESIESLLRFWQAGRILMPFLAAVSLSICYLSLRLYIPLFFAARRIRNISRDCNVTRSENKAPFGAAAPGGIRDVALPVAATRTAYIAGHMQEFVIGHMRPCEQYLNILRTVVACAPLLGLLGTVNGMITTFTALGRSGMATVDMLSTGISEALITTEIGLIVAIPGLISAYASAQLIARMKDTLGRIGLHQGRLRDRKTQASLLEAST